MRAPRARCRSAMTVSSSSPPRVVEIHVDAARRESPQARAQGLRAVVDAGREARVARHPLAFLARPGDTDRARALQHRDLSGHRARGVRGRPNQHRLPGAQLREIQQSEVGGHAGRAEHAERAWTPAFVPDARSGRSGRGTRQTAAGRRRAPRGCRRRRRRDATRSPRRRRAPAPGRPAARSRGCRWRRARRGTGRAPATARGRGTCRG